VVDIVRQAIEKGEICISNISFDKLRSVAGINRELRDHLDRGKKIPDSCDELDQYLYSYGLMVKKQWQHFLQGIAIPEGAVRILDYGCGQGLAGIMLFDVLGRAFINRVKSVVLIEPSAVALGRAVDVLKVYLGKRPIDDLQMRFDELLPENLGSVEGTNNIHLLSNVLDIDSFDHFGLFKKMLAAKGQHSVFAVSHDRNFAGGTERFKQLEESIGEKKYRSGSQSRHRELRNSPSSGATRQG